MPNLQQILALLEEKRRLFLEFERATEDMLVCSVEELEEFVLERSRLINRIDTLDIKIESAIISDDSTYLLSIITCECDRGSLSGELGEIYDASAAVRSVISRIFEAEAQASARLVREQEHLIELIKSTNRGVGAKAARYTSGQYVGGSSYHITDA